MNRIRVLVVDDEPLARTGVRTMLEADPEMDVVGEAASAAEAIDLIQQLRPELVMLDVQMPDGTGFDVIRRVGLPQMPAVVFITAYDEFAVAAFEVNAVDYLLKPFDDERFAITMERAKKVARQAHVGELTRRLADLLAGAGAPVSAATPAPAHRYVDRLAVKSAGRTFFLRVAEIDWIEAADYYVRIHVGKVAHLLRESLNTLETRLDPTQFFRVHRSAIVNIDRIRELQPYFHGNYVLILHDGTKLKLSRARRDRLESALHQRL
jgi:two-component system, LytTR family, response regulator